MDQTILATSCKMFSRFGIQQLRMEDLAGHLGISKKTLYRFFPSRMKLIEKVEAEMSKELRLQLLAARDESGGTLVQLTVYVSTLTSTFKKWSPLFFSDLQKHFPEQWNRFHKNIGQLVLDLLRTNLEKGIAEGVYRGNIHPALLVTLWQQHFYNDYRYCQQLVTDYSKDEVFRQGYYLFLYGIVAQSAVPRLETLLNRITEESANNKTTLQIDPAADLNQAFI